jgi:pSer/pThr/pTyr-binding forkhead associated (FHA) protein
MEKKEYNANDITQIGIPAILQNDSESKHKEQVTSENNDALAQLPDNSAFLIVTNGDTAGARFLLNKDEIFIGRSENADIMLDDSPVSRKHARIIRRGELFEIEDSGSLNGTYLNDQIISDSQPMKSGDVLQFGRYKLLFLKK